MFLEGVKSALTADAAFKDGWYDEPPAKGLRAAARVYAGWGFSQAFYWDGRMWTSDGSGLTPRWRTSSSASGRASSSTAATRTTC